MICQSQDATLLQVTAAGAKQAPEAFLHDSEGSDNEYSDATAGSTGLPSAPSSPITGAGLITASGGPPTPTVAAGDSPTTPMKDPATDTLPSTASSPSTEAGQCHVLATGVVAARLTDQHNSTLTTNQQGCESPHEQHLPDPAVAGADRGRPTQDQQGSEGSAAMAVSAAIDAPAVSGCKPTVAAPVSVPTSHEVTGAPGLTEAAVVEAMPASALLPRSGSAELPPLDAEDLGVELKQRANSVQVRFAWRLPQRKGWPQQSDGVKRGSNRVPSVCSALSVQLVRGSLPAQGSTATRIDRAELHQSAQLLSVRHVATRSS